MLRISLIPNHPTKEESKRYDDYVLATDAIWSRIISREFSSPESNKFEDRLEAEKRMNVDIAVYKQLVLEYEYGLIAEKHGM